MGPFVNERERGYPLDCEPFMRYLTHRRANTPGQSTNAAAPNARASIARRLRWSYLISSTLPLLVVGALLININMVAQQRSVYSDQRALAARTSRDITRYLDGLRDQLVRYALLVRPATPLDQLVEAAQDMQARTYPHLIDLAVLDGAGRERLRVNRLQATPAAQLRDRGGEENVQRALAGQSTYSAISADKTFIATLPLRNDAGQIIGALRAEISAEPIAQELRLSTANSSSYAYLVAHDSGAILLDDGAPGFVAPRTLAYLLATESGTAEYSGARNQDVIGALDAVRVGENDEPTGWAVVVEQPAAIAFASVWRSVLILTLLVILVGGLALLWAFRQAQRFLRPLAALRAGAAALGAGHLEHRIAPLDNDELGDLAQTFNQMAAHLQESLAEIERRNERLRHGLALARDIQIGLLPSRPPWSDEAIAVYARSIPAYEVGGDFYTYLALSEGRAAIAIGDISGKGVGAALLMALTASAVESHGRELEHPAEVLTALNQALTPRLKANHMNAALLFAVIDPQRRMLRVANAGMIAPILVAASPARRAATFIEVGGLPLGAFAAARYEEAAVALHPGDSLLLVSDGVVEAHNAQGELFGFDRLEATIAAAARDRAVRPLVESVLERVQAFMGETEQHDDMTIVAVQPAIAQEPGTLDEEQTIRYATV
jgi:serine phosphatase RsbU (regulator of sigma subunit)